MNNFNKNKINDNRNIFIVIPVFNEEKTIGKLAENLSKIGYTVVIVNDGSLDKTYEIAMKCRLKYPENIFVLNHVINRGVGVALNTGMSFSVLKGAKDVVTFDGDGQHDIEDIPNVVKPLKENNAEVVNGARTLEDMPFTKNFANSIMNFLTYIFYGVKVKDSQTGFKGFKSEIIPKINIISSGYGAISEFLREIHKNNLKFEEVNIKTIYTPETQNKGTNMWVGLKIMLKMIINMFK
jgi:glycosyltransferase involved in cell wall biosynthesis